MDNMLMPQQPQQSATGAPATASSEEVAQARSDTATMTKGLMALAAKPKGSLSKQDLYDSAADMIAAGAFATPQAKQALVAELAQVPDNEAAIRQVIGQHLMFLAHAHERIHATYGPGA